METKRLKVNLAIVVVILSLDVSSIYLNHTHRLYVRRGRPSDRPMTKSQSWALILYFVSRKLTLYILQQAQCSQNLAAGDTLNAYNVHGRYRTHNNGHLLCVQDL
jgi:hypothetical protein